jgi:hypothetical protein
MRSEKAKAELIELKCSKSSNPVSVFVEVVWCGDKRIMIKPAHIQGREAEGTLGQSYLTSEWLL